MDLKTFVVSGKSKMIENIKILAYKEDSEVFNFVNFDNDTIYLEPLLFAYFNRENKDEKYIKSILYGYSENRESISVKVKSDIFGRIYVPNLGWIIIKEIESELFLCESSGELLITDDNGKSIDFYLEKLKKINGIGIEILSYSIPLLEQFYFDVDDNRIQVEIEEITKKHSKNIIKAYWLIKKFAPNHFELILELAPKCVIFDVNTYLRNSFSTMSAQGIGFYNAYQKDYNEVFFVDDIAHQTGHAIFDVIIYEQSEFFKISSNTVIDKIQRGDFIEDRPVLVVFHALFTYYTTFICLHACIINKALEGRKEHEALGRIAFYLIKCRKDLKIFIGNSNSTNKLSGIFTEKGLAIFGMIEKKWEEMYEVYYPLVKEFNMLGHPYNFTYKIFKEQNPFQDN
ncbi:hypothetical protein D9V96_018710 [Zobellia laminariae]|uniref:hypothetical protein n=1 Tax=Zobellia laminariae TaxID=248906 RepID=UPI0012D98A1A|nr:hypothetical protein [Zobellia laminariae]